MEQAQQKSKSKSRHTSTSSKDPKSKPKYTPVRKVVKQLSLGMSVAEAGKSNNVSQQAIRQLLQRHGIQAKELEQFKEKRADILAGLQADCLQALSEDKLKEATAQQLATTFGILHDKERAERGLGQAPAVVIYASAVELAFTQATQHVVLDVTPSCEAEAMKHDGE